MKYTILTIANSLKLNP